ncbi:Uncharacterized oxidoreductase At4g09670 [Linum perenne]
MSSSSEQQQQQPKIRFGIIGCADIARKLARAITLSPNSDLSAVASRTPAKARAFAGANNLPPEVKIYGSYESLLDDPEIDVVYIPLPTSLHLKWATLAAQKKKHVLLEKPVAVTVDELDRILDACEANGVQFMDGTMWIHHPRTVKMKEVIDRKEEFGKLRTVQSCLTFAADESFLKSNIRANPNLDSLGALGDVGWYCAYSILWATDYSLPKTVSATPSAVISDAGVILACGASLQWTDGKSANFHCSFLTNFTSTVTAMGTKATLQVTDYVIPMAEEAAAFTVAVETGFDEIVTKWEKGLPGKVVVENELPQEVCMVREMSRLVASVKGGGGVDRRWGERSRKVQMVLDAVKESIENGYQPVEIGN